MTKEEALELLKQTNAVRLDKELLKKAFKALDLVLKKPEVEDEEE
tara:strand:+ start:56 stop:190 length:135 start_codon:yes stop_codon:yes gene_type:complete